MSTPTEHEPLAVADIDAITGDDLASWIGNKFLPPENLLAKVCWTINVVLAQRDAALIAKAKTEGWDEGYSHCFDLGPNEVRSLDDNPYRAADSEAGL